MSNPGCYATAARPATRFLNELTPCTPVLPRRLCWREAREGCLAPGRCRSLIRASQPVEDQYITLRYLTSLRALHILMGASSCMERGMIVN